MKILSVLSIVSVIACFAGMADAQTVDELDCDKPNAHYWMDGVMCLQKIIDRGVVGGGHAMGDMGFCRCSAGGKRYQRVAQYVINQSKFRGCRMFYATENVISAGGYDFSFGKYDCSGL
ncbi:hypothetical protein BGW38_010087 [Lunasporangiospora selenospora]|uniref:Uncharacterized protein n=1 Tax=Lunasporangiospora selenospora TaxID=979761 RepID=A0A9P6KFN9_9FUNG|nr:hypothetical protein BGW38_010087 [Lunasporangiospora selenospora]